MSPREFEAQILAVRAGFAARAATAVDGAVVIFPAVVVADKPDDAEDGPYRSAWPLTVSVEPGSVFGPGLHPVTFSGAMPDGIHVEGTFYVGVGQDAPRRTTKYTRNGEPASPDAWMVDLPGSVTVPIQDSATVATELARVVREGDYAMGAAAAAWEPAVHGFLNKKYRESIRREQSHFSEEDAFQEGASELVRALTRFASNPVAGGGHRPATTMFNHLKWSVPNRIRDALDRGKAKGTGAQSAETGKIRSFKRRQEGAGVRFANATELRDAFAINNEVNKLYYGPKHVSRDAAEKIVQAQVAAGTLIPVAKHGLGHFEIAFAPLVGFISADQRVGGEDTTRTLLDTLPDRSVSGFADTDSRIDMEILFDQRQLSALERMVVVVYLGLYDADPKPLPWGVVAQMTGIQDGFSNDESANAVLRKMLRSGLEKLGSDQPGYYAAHRAEAEQFARRAQARLQRAHAAALRRGEEPGAAVPSVKTLADRELATRWRASLKGEAVNQNSTQVAFLAALGRAAVKGGPAAEIAAANLAMGIYRQAAARLEHPVGSHQTALDLGLVAHVAAAGRGTPKTGSKPTATPVRKPAPKTGSKPAPKTARKATPKNGSRTAPRGVQLTLPEGA